MYFYGGINVYRDVEARASFAQRAKNALDRAEGLYLRVLRAVILVLATLFLIYAAWLAASSLYKISQSPDSIVESVAKVLPDELTDAELPAPTLSEGTFEGSPKTTVANQRFYSNFADRYYALYRMKFEPYRQPQDKQLTRSEFDGAFLNTPARLEAISKGDLSFEDDRADLQTLQTVMTEAAEKPATIERLQRYKSARRVPVKKQVEKTRITYVDGWDSSSTDCANWYTSPIGCRATQPVATPYTESVTSLEFPQGTQSHTQIFKAFQDRFFTLLQSRRESNARTAEQERHGIVVGIAEGHLSLFTALQILGGFLVLMFFFLLIAIERHQRRLAQVTDSESPPKA